MGRSIHEQEKIYLLCYLVALCLTVCSTVPLTAFAKSKAEEKAQALTSVEVTGIDVPAAGAALDNMATVKTAETAPATQTAASSSAGSTSTAGNTTPARLHQLMRLIRHPFRRQVRHPTREVAQTLLHQARIHLMTVHHVQPKQLPKQQNKGGYI